MTKFNFSTEMIAIAKKVASLGGIMYLVGGAVRDAFMGRPVHDHDFVVEGVEASVFEEAFNNPPKTGNLFPVYRIMVCEEECEFALARKEIKTGEGHNGFTMSFDASISIEEDLARRDLTVNAIAVNVITSEIIDPFHGVKDIEAKILRATSSHFIEDPLRVLRVARMATTFGFEVAKETLHLMKACHDELPTLPSERIWKEMEKALGANKPSKFYRVLQASNTLDVVFPEVFALIGQEQPAKFHPEGDAFEHSMMVLDEVSAKTNDIVARFCALCHDLGKGLTPVEMLPRHYHHDKEGENLIQKWENGRFPARLKKAATVVAGQHMKAHHLSEMKPAKVFDLLKEVRPELEAFRAVVEADSHRNFKILSDASVKEVFGKVEIPEDLLGAGDGERIRDYVRQVRIQRVRELRG